MLQTVMHVAGAVAHHLVLDLFPAEQRLLDEHLVDRAGRHAARDDALRTPRRVCAMPPPVPPSVYAGRMTAGRPICSSACARFVVVGDDDGLRRRLADLVEHLAEQLAVLGLAYRLERRAEQAHAVLLEHARLVQRDGHVQAGLAAERRQQAVGPLALDDARDDVDVDRLDVDDVGDAFVGHDRRRVGVDEHGDDALFAHRLAGLRAGVVELGSLADDDRAGADDEDFRGFVHALRSSWTAKGVVVISGASRAPADALLAAPAARACRRDARRRATPATNAAAMAMANDAGMGIGVDVSM